MIKTPKYSYTDYTLDSILEFKKKKNVSISCVFPTLNEEFTIKHVIEYTYQFFMENHKILDEFIILDGGSTDNTVKICENYDFISLYHQDSILKNYSILNQKGKGNALFKSLLISNSDIIIWVDSDIKNYDYKFILGLLGPLLIDNCKFSKGFYKRPYLTNDNQISSDKSMSGGRVTELCARPMFNLLYPELGDLIQPLGGEYGGYRKYLESLAFSSGYGVETELLINMFEIYGIDSIAQVDLGERIHRHQPLNNLTKMSFVINQVFFNKIEEKYNLTLMKNYNLLFLPNNINESNYNKVREGGESYDKHFLEQNLKEIFIPPIINTNEYLYKYYPNCKKIKLKLIRHGETHSNEKGIIQGISETFLNKNGYSQTVELKSKLFNCVKDDENNNFNLSDKLIFSSDLERCKQTVDILFNVSTSKINKMTSDYTNKSNESIKEIHFTPFLRERDMGIYTEVLSKDVPNDLLYKNEIDKGESIDNINKRIELFMELCMEFLKQNEDTTNEIYVVTHSTFLMYFYKYYFNILPNEIPSNCSISEFSLFVNNGTIEKIHLESWNKSNNISKPFS